MMIIFEHIFGHAAELSHNQKIVAIGFCFTIFICVNVMCFMALASCWTLRWLLIGACIAFSIVLVVFAHPKKGTEHRFSSCCNPVDYDQPRQGS